MNLQMQRDEKYKLNLEISKSSQATLGKRTLRSLRSENMKYESSLILKPYLTVLHMITGSYCTEISIIFFVSFEFS